MQRSPRWALWTRFVIPCENGLAYLVRRRILQTPWFGIYLHDIHEPDGDRDPHNHPWSFISIILRGYYIEKYHPIPGVDLGVRKRVWQRWSIHRMGRVAAHRIIEAGPNLKTLIITGPRRGEWGFYRDHEFVPWQEYENKGAS